MRILITGATGFIGHHLVGQLVARGDHVIALVRSPAKAAKTLPPGVETLAGDLSLFAEPSTVLPECDVVIHLAEDPSDEEPSATPRSPDAKRKCSAIAIRFFRGFLHPESPDPAIRLETAIAYRYMADVFSVNGERHNAHDAYRSAIDVFEPLVADYPKNFIYRRELALV